MTGKLWLSGRRWLCWTDSAAVCAVKGAKFPERPRGTLAGARHTGYQDLVSSSIVHRLMSLPFVYNRVRPALLGGIDMSSVYRVLSVKPTDVVLDVGCGPGTALTYLSEFHEFQGFDVDDGAITAAKDKYGDRKNVKFFARELASSDVEALQPTVCVMCGLLHHLDDETTLAVLRSLHGSKRLRRAATLDISFFPGKTVNNLLSVLDRGQYPRRPEGYARLAEEAGFKVTDQFSVSSTPKHDLILYWVMAFEPINPPD